MSWRRDAEDWPHDALPEITKEDVAMGRRIGYVLFTQRLKALGWELLENNQFDAVVLDPMGMDISPPDETPPEVS